MMKKNLLMLLCAVSLLAHTVHAENTAASIDFDKERSADDPIYAGLKKLQTAEALKAANAADFTAENLKNEGDANVPAMGKMFANPEMHDLATADALEKLSLANRISNYGRGTYGSGFGRYVPRAKGFGHFRGAGPHGLAHATRLANALIALDMIGRDKNSLLYRGAGRFGNWLGFRRNAGGIRGSVANALAGDHAGSRAGRTALALLLAGALDQGSARLVGDPTWYSMMHGRNNPYRTRQEARKFLGLDVDPETVKTVVEDAGDIVPGLGDGFDDDGMDLDAARAKYNADAATRIQRGLLPHIGQGRKLRSTLFKRDEDGSYTPKTMPARDGFDWKKVKVTGATPPAEE